LRSLLQVLRQRGQEKAMHKRRIAAFAGAIGLLGALFSSGVAVRADTLPGVDATLSSLMSTYLSSSQDACVGGTSSYDPVTQTTTCKITETSIGDKNIAVCVQSNTPGLAQQCIITQTNDSGNNYALVFQHVVDNGGPTQNFTQRSTISQNMMNATSTGSDFAAIVQIVIQSTKQAGDQSQIVHQFNTTDQMSITGTNFASLNESSDQSAQSDASKQTQFSEQDASDPNGHINQHSSGLSRAFVTQSQLQNLVGTGVQMQTIDPRCCSVQDTNAGDVFTITQSDGQKGGPQASQSSFSFGTCDTTGQCTVTQSSRTNSGTFGPTTTCTGKFCASTVSCTSTVCRTGGDFRIAAAYSNEARAIARVGASLASLVRGAQSVPSGGLLT
jgi:hypothetical protein